MMTLLLRMAMEERKGFWQVNENQGGRKGKSAFAFEERGRRNTDRFLIKAVDKL